jgi:hypothetical protein
MDFGIKENIVAVVTSNKSIIGGQCAPVFIAKDESEGERLALIIAKTTMGMLHQLDAGTYIIVRH